MIKLLLSLIVRYVDNDCKRQKGSDDDFSIVIYEVINRQNVILTRIDIFTKESANGKD